MYCSDECANHDASHKKFCPSKVAQYVEIKQKCIVEALKIVGDFDLMVGLLMDDMKKTVFDFDFSNSDDPMYKKNLLMSVNSLSTAGVAGLCSAGIRPNPSELVAFPTEGASKYLSIWATNAFNMHEDRRILFGPASGMYQFAEDIGSGIFPFMSLLNHSCYPNVDTTAVDNKIVLTVSRPIKAGEQIFITYGYSSVSYKLEERKQGLADYKFVCDCIACIEDYPKLKKLPKVKLCGFKEPPNGVISREDAIKQFKINCDLIEKNIKKHPSYEIMKLIDYNRFLLYGLVRL